MLHVDRVEWQREHRFELSFEYREAETVGIFSLLQCLVFPPLRNVDSIARSVAWPIRTALVLESVRALAFSNAIQGAFQPKTLVSVKGG